MKSKKVEVITYLPMSHILPNLEMPTPRAYNGYVFYRKCKVTVEEVEEDVDLVICRLQGLLADRSVHSSRISREAIREKLRELGVEQFGD